jgi:hypothetical protein
MAINKETTWILKRCTTNQRTILLLILGIFLQTGCLSYKHAPLSINSMQKLKDKKVQLYLIDNENVLSEVWALKSYRFDKNDISCKIEQLPPSKARDLMTLSSQKDAHQSRNDVRLYAKSSLVQQLKSTDSVTFDYHLLERIEVTELDDDRTLGKTALKIFVIVGIAILSILLLFFILFATDGF